MPSRSGEAGGRGRRPAVLRSSRLGRVGAVRPGCLLGLLLLGLAIYAGVQVLASEMDYRSLQEAAVREARFADTRSDDEIRQALVAEVGELELPRSANDVRVRRLGSGSVHIAIAYPDTIRFLGRWEWVRPRRISVRTPR